MKNLDTLLKYLIGTDEGLLFSAIAIVAIVAFLAWIRRLAQQPAPATAEPLPPRPEPLNERSPRRRRRRRIHVTLDSRVIRLLSRSVAGPTPNTVRMKGGKVTASPAATATTGKIETTGGSSNVTVNVMFPPAQATSTPVSPDRRREPAAPPEASGVIIVNTPASSAEHRFVRTASSLVGSGVSVVDNTMPTVGGAADGVHIVLDDGTDNINVTLSGGQPLVVTTSGGMNGKGHGMRVGHPGDGKSGMGLGAEDTGAARP